MVRERKRKSWGIFGIIVFVCIAGVVAWFCYENREKISSGEIIAELKDDLALEKTNLENWLSGKQENGFTYEVTDDMTGEQFTFNMITDVLDDQEACNWSEYASQEIIKAYCTLSGAYDDDEHAGEMTAEDPVLIEDVVPTE